MNQSLKINVLNFFRNIFKIRFLEFHLASLTRGRSTHHFVCKFVPNPYQYSSGTFRILKRNGIVMEVDISDYIGHYLFFGFEDAGMKKLFSLCRENSNVLDIGTNIGWTVLNLGAIATNGIVVGFEPDTYNFGRCSGNIALNNFGNITIFPVGLGDKNLQMNMEVRTPFNRGGNRIAPQGVNSLQIVEIVKLDDFKPVTELPSVDLIKIDVEGYELNVLRGASALLKKYKPTLFIELDNNNLKDQGDSAFALIKFLFELGYKEIKHAESEIEISDKTDFTNCHFDIIVK